MIRIFESNITKLWQRDKNVIHIRVLQSFSSQLESHVHLAIPKDAEVKTILYEFNVEIRVLQSRIILISGLLDDLI